MMYSTVALHSAWVRSFQNHAAQLHHIGICPHRSMDLLWYLSPANDGSCRNNMIRLALWQDSCRFAPTDGRGQIEQWAHKPWQPFPCNYPKDADKLLQTTNTANALLVERPHYIRHSFKMPTSQTQFCRISRKTNRQELELPCLSSSICGSVHTAKWGEEVENMYKKWKLYIATFSSTWNPSWPLMRGQQEAGGSS